jgi:hypothetical protein
MCPPSIIALSMRTNLPDGSAGTCTSLRSSFKGVDGTGRCLRISRKSRPMGVVGAATVVICNHNCCHPPLASRPCCFSRCQGGVAHAVIAPVKLAIARGRCSVGISCKWRPRRSNSVQATCLKCFLCCCFSCLHLSSYICCILVWE